MRGARDATADTFFACSILRSLSLRFPIRTPSRECYSFSLVEGPTVKTRFVGCEKLTLYEEEAGSCVYPIRREIMQPQIIIFPIRFSIQPSERVDLKE